MPNSCRVAVRLPNICIPFERLYAPHEKTAKYPMIVLSVKKAPEKAPSEAFFNDKLIRFFCILTICSCFIFSKEKHFTINELIKVS